MTLKNWAQNVSFTFGECQRPLRVEQVQDIVRGAAEAQCRVRVKGTGHSFNRIADPGSAADTLISLENLRNVISVDEKTRTAVVEAGITYGELCPVLHERGLAVHNLASLPHVTVAGAVATGTHGSGLKNKNLGDSVVGIDIVDKSGALVSLKRGDVDFLGAVCSAGSLGVVVRLTLQLIPAFRICQTVYDAVSLEEVSASQERFEEVFGLAYSVSIFTRWEGSRNGNKETMLWLKEKAGETRKMVPGYLHASGARPASGKRHPIISIDPAPCTEQMGIPGPWHERLCHFKYDQTPSVGDELQSEFFVPLHCGAEAIRAILALGPMFEGVLATTELRVVAADDLWLSPCCKRQSLGMHFTWRAGMFEAVWHCAHSIESILAPFGYRPHLGKVFTCDAETAATAYRDCGLDKFIALQKKMGGEIFLNDFVHAYVMGNSRSVLQRKALQGGRNLPASKL